MQCSDTPPSPPSFLNALAAKTVGHGESADARQRLPPDESRDHRRECGPLRKGPIRRCGTPGNENTLDASRPSRPERPNRSDRPDFPIDHPLAYQARSRGNRRIRRNATLRSTGRVGSRRLCPSPEGCNFTGQRAGRRAVIRTVGR